MGWLGTIFSKLIGFIPFIGPLVAQLLTSWSTRNAEAEKAKAETEKVEAEAFKEGRISPRYLLGYVRVCVYALFVLLIVCAVFFPEVVGISDEAFDSIIKAGKLVEGVAP